MAGTVRGLEMVSELIQFFMLDLVERLKNFTEAMMRWIDLY